MNYDKLTHSDEYRIIQNLANNIGVNGLLAMPGVYNLVREELNNDMLQEWEDEQEHGSTPFTVGQEYPYSSFDKFSIELHGPDTIGYSTVHIKIGRITYTFLMTRYKSECVYRCVYAE